MSDLVKQLLLNNVYVQKVTLEFLVKNVPQDIKGPIIDVVSFKWTLVLLATLVILPEALIASFALAH